MAAVLSIYQSGWPAISFVVLMMIFGFAVNQLWGARDRELKETLLNIVVFLVGYGMQVAGINQIQNLVLNHIDELLPWRIPENAWTFALAYVAVDFVYYWRHRLEHNFEFLWAEHCVHHNSRELNLSTAGRLPWIMIATLWIAYLPLVMVGFDPVVLVTCWSLNMGFQFLAHVAFRWPTPWLDLIFSTPSNHRVHHAENANYLHRNFGGTFILWDRIFGTYAAEREPVKIGCGQPFLGHNPIKVNFLPMIWYFQSLKGGESLLRWGVGSGDPISRPERLSPPQSPSQSGQIG
jgi:sterol desaturase/sphingolipid hydroxylase (fatty acid hydroxylase superfamily)